MMMKSNPKGVGVGDSQTKRFLENILPTKLGGPKISLPIFLLSILKGLSRMMGPNYERESIFLL
jgi:hypothetical protein